MQDPRDDNVRHFAWIKNLSRLMSSQLSKKELRKYIFAHDSQQMNKCAIRLPSEKDKWLEFNNYNSKELLPFVVYADFECMLKKTNNDPMMSTYTFQHHEVFSIAYYIHCAYDETLSADLYLKTDVLLLADIFENFRESCIKSYGVDPTYYYTLPGFTWDNMLKHTNIKFELLIDIDMAVY
ncbi:hypothetical protein ACFW04_007457 [Cataglyphis niger]